MFEACTLQIPFIQCFLTSIPKGIPYVTSCQRVYRELKLSLFGIKVYKVDKIKLKAYKFTFPFLFFIFLLYKICVLLNV